jgi:hypothetical protein
MSSRGTAYRWENRAAAAALRSGIFLRLHGRLREVWKRWILRSAARFLRTGVLALGALVRRKTTYLTGGGAVLMDPLLIWWVGGLEWIFARSQPI